MKTLINFYSHIKAYYYPASRHAYYKENNRRIGLLFTILLLLIRAKYNNDNAIKVRLFGFKVSANCPQTLLQLVKEIFLEQVYLFHSDNPAPRIIDWGANMGISVLYFKSLFPEAHIIAIEPNPNAFGYLEKNIAQNSLSHVESVEACLSDGLGMEKFYLAQTGSIINGSIYPESEKSYMKEVASVRLSDYLEEGEFDLVKIDVEGAERQVLRDLKQSGLMKKSRQYLLEYHNFPGLEDIQQELLETFEQNGFQSMNQGEVLSGQGNVLMHFSRAKNIYSSSKLDQ